MAEAEGGGPGLSGYRRGRVLADVGRYLEIIALARRALLDTFTDVEFRLIYRAMLPVVRGGDLTHLVLSLWGSGQHRQFWKPVGDLLDERQRPAEFADVHRTTVMSELGALDLVQALALVDAVERYFALTAREDLPAENAAGELLSAD